MVKKNKTSNEELTFLVSDDKGKTSVSAWQLLTMLDNGQITGTDPIYIQGKDKPFTLSQVGKTPKIIRADQLKTKRLVNGNQLLLDEMDFEIAKGEMVYIIGKSGAGKTVLLKMLGGYDKEVTNDAVFKGALTWKDNNRVLKKYVGYVPQIDSLYTDLTPAKLLKYYQKIFKKYDADVYEILEDLGLAHRADQKIEAMSGGERKRVSIAIELLRDADIILLDEPDSGLDPDSRRDLSRILDEINVKRNKTILLSTHYQDNIQGKNRVKEVEDLFRYNTAQLGKGTVKMYRRIDSPELEPKKTTKPPYEEGTSRYTGSWKDILFMREFRLYRNNAMILAFVSLICMGFLFLATIPETFYTYTDALPVVFAMSCGAILIGLMLSINMVCKDYDMIRRELRMGITARSLIVSKTILIIGLCAIMSAILALPYLFNAYRIIDQRTGLLYVSVFFTMLAAAALGLLVSAISRNKPQRAALSIPFVMLFQILFSGFVFEQVRINISSISISHYSIRAMGSAMRFDNENFIWDTPHGAFNSAASFITDNLAFMLGFFMLAVVISIVFLYLVDRKGWR